MLPIESLNCVPDVDTLAILSMAFPVNPSSISQLVVPVPDVFPGGKVTPDVLHRYEKPPCWLGVSKFNICPIVGIVYCPFVLFSKYFVSPL